MIMENVLLEKKNYESIILIVCFTELVYLYSSFLKIIDNK